MTTLRKTARESGIAQRAIAWTDLKNSLKVVRLYSNPSSLRPKETSSPVSIRNIPTPPIHLAVSASHAYSRMIDLPNQDMSWEISNK